MSNDLTARLDQALQSVEPSPAPIAAAIRSGRARRNRRYAAVTGGMAAVIAAAVVSAGPLHHTTAPSAAPAITVNPPGPDSPAGTVASGTIGKKTWWIREDSRGCVITGGTTFPGANVTTGCDETNGGMYRGDIVALAGTGAGNISALYGPVRADVASIVVRLSDGADLTLHPVMINRERTVGFAFPGDAGVSIDSATAYTTAGQVIATAVPFQAGSIPSFVSWLSPGQHGLARASGVLIRGVHAYAGPWGVCVVAGSASGCAPTSAVMGTSLSLSGGTPRVVTGYAGPSVAYIRVTSHAHLLPGRIPIIKIGVVRMFAFQVRGADHWAAYTASGQVVTSGPIPRP